MVEGQRRRAITRLRQRFALPPPHGFATGRIKGRNRPFATALSRFPIIEHRLLLFANEARRRSALTRSVIRSEEHTSELQSLMRISYAVFCLKKKQKPMNT